MGVDKCSIDAFVVARDETVIVGGRGGDGGENVGLGSSNLKDLSFRRYYKG